MVKNPRVFRPENVQDQWSERELVNHLRFITKRIFPSRIGKLMELYNQVMRDLAAREGIELVDLAAMLPKTTEVFYDDCHFNDSGARMVAAALAEQVKTRPLKAGARK